MIVSDKFRCLDVGYLSERVPKFAVVIQLTLTIRNCHLNLESSDCGFPPTNARTQPPEKNPQKSDSFLQAHDVLVFGSFFWDPASLLARMLVYYIFCLFSVICKCHSETHAQKNVSASDLRV